MILLWIRDIRDRLVAWFMVFNATFNNISVISWRSVFISGGNRSTQWKPLTCRKSLTNFYHIMLYISPWVGFELTTLVVICTDCIGSYKTNYHTTTTAISRIYYANSYYEWTKLLFKLHMETTDRITGNSCSILWSTRDHRN
jgi:hypothetical protein